MSAASSLQPDKPAVENNNQAGSRRLLPAPPEIVWIPGAAPSGKWQRLYRRHALHFTDVTQTSQRPLKEGINESNLQNRASNVTGFVLTVAIASHGHRATQQLVGTWLFISEITVFPDGKRLEGFGGDQKGIISTARVIIRHNSRALRALNSRPLAFKERPRRTRAYPRGRWLISARIRSMRRVQPSLIMWNAARSRTGMTRIKMVDHQARGRRLDLGCRFVPRRAGKLN